MDELIYLHGESEPLGVDIIEEDTLPQHVIDGIREMHRYKKPNFARQVSLIGFGVDHGLNAHSGNGDKWRTTVVAVVRLDYLNNEPIVYARLEDVDATDLLVQLAEAVSIRERGRFMDSE